MIASPNSQSLCNIWGDCTKTLPVREDGGCSFENRWNLDTLHHLPNGPKNHETIYSIFLIKCQAYSHAYGSAEIFAHKKLDRMSSRAPSNEVLDDAAALMV
jgi:hypothetical protein